MNKKPTMNDVAKLAGVGRATVSNYINGQKIKETNKVKVENAIKKLGYVPNLQARGLKTGQNSTVVFIVPTNWTPFFSEMVFKMQAELSRQGYKMILANSHSSPEEEKNILKMASRNQVSGVITMSYSDIYNVMNFSKNSNLVSIERYVSEDVPLVTSDNAAGGKLAADKLIAMGKKKLLLLRRAVNHHNATDVRTDAFIKEAEDHNLQVDVFEASLNDTYREELYQFFKKHFTNKKEIPYDGIFAVTDEYGEIAQEALILLKPKWLRQIEIIGFDGATMSQAAPRVIDSIRQPIDEIVKNAVEILIKKVNGEQIEKNWKKVLPIDFVKKEKLF